MTTADSQPLSFDAARYLSLFQPLLALPREALPRLTGEAARRALRCVAEELRMELAETGGLAPTFLLLPPMETPPRVALFATWHAEPLPVTPAALEGAERLALVAALAALGGLRAGPEPLSAALVAPPAATHGSLVLAEALARHRERLRAGSAFWIRIAASAPGRRRIFLGSRGRVVLGLWGGNANPYAIRDEVVRSLAEEAYGPRPLDFELLRKLAGSREAMDLLEETLVDPPSAMGEGETRLKNALFQPRGHVLAPAVRRPERPSAWIVFETAENMEAPEIRARVESLTGGARVELAEAFPWDRIGIHHPAVKAAIAESKARSTGPEIWPTAPWSTPSGAFARGLGVPLLEWAVPLPQGGAVRFPEPETFGPIQWEIASLLQRAGAAAGSPSPG